MDNTFDRIYYDRGDLIGGLDESGVSDIAGPLIAACVILPKITDLHKHDLRIFEVNDSKKIPEQYRPKYASVIWEVAEAIGIGEVQAPEIDYLGRHKSSTLAMLRAVAACRKVSGKKSILKPDFLIVDGHRKVHAGIDQAVIREGDEKSLCVASASIVAKVYRDQIMVGLHDKYPWYDWINNKGYPCENQFRGIDEKGIQVGIHRIKFWPFIPNPHPKFKENSKKWSQRRATWRHMTELELKKRVKRTHGLQEINP